MLFLSGCGFHPLTTKSDNLRQTSAAAPGSGPEASQGGDASNAKRPDPRPVEEGEGVPTFLADHVHIESDCPTADPCTVVIVGLKAVDLKGRNFKNFEVVAFLTNNNRRNPLALSLTLEETVILSRSEVDANGSFALGGVPKSQLDNLAIGIVNFGSQALPSDNGQQDKPNILSARVTKDNTFAFAAYVPGQPETRPTAKATTTATSRPTPKMTNLPTTRPTLFPTLIPTPVCVPTMMPAIISVPPPATYPTVAPIITEDCLESERMKDLRHLPRTSEWF